MDPSISVPASLVRSHLIGLEAEDDGLQTVLRRVGLSTTALGRAQRIPLPQFTRLLRAAWEHLGSETGGFTREPIRLGSFAMMCKATITCPNLRRALLRSARFYALLSDELEIRLLEYGDEARLVVHHANRRRLDDHGLIESLLLVWLRWASWLIDREILPEHAHFGFPAPDYADEYWNLFPCEHYFDETAHSLTFASRYLDLPVARDQAELSEFLANAPECLMLRYRSEDSLSSQVRSRLKRAEHPERMSLEDIAAGMHISPQSLRRKLREEGNGFQELKDGVRRQEASKLLAYSSLSVNEIAARLGFSEASAFHRAFRKWTGQTPGKYRDQYSRPTSPP